MTGDPSETAGVPGILNNRVMCSGEAGAFFSDPRRLGMRPRASSYAPDGGAAGGTRGTPTKLPDTTGTGRNGARRKVKRLLR